ncbi:MAG: biotin--[acetyl-CoA-carboxylase] ligase [Saccharofermentans sp.]|nr:biotin--[acetyl-CoA-carboxylase] ligase [Saccharofermentans sp.]
MISTKDYVISKLLSTDGYISGESLSLELGISRAAVNSAVKSLRNDGYDIESVTNRGYHLNNHPDLLTTGEVLALISENRMQTINVLTEVDSTNKMLKDLAYNGAPEGTVVMSDFQTAGRGRLGRTFASPKGKGIYISYLLRPTTSPEIISKITCWSAVAVRNAILRTCNIKPSIKWVNDLQINGKKICGILTEMNIESEIGTINSVVIGIGINVNNDLIDFPEEIRDIASSIRLETNEETPIHRASLVATLIDELDKLCTSFPDANDKYLEQYRESCSTVGLDVSVVSAHNHTSEIPRLGTAIGIGDDFSLQVIFEDGHSECLSSGEVSVIRR